MIYKFLKEIWSILQLPINFSYTIDARFVNHAFMIQLSMLTMAMYIQTILVSEYRTIIFLWFYTKIQNLCCKENKFNLYIDWRTIDSTFYACLLYDFHSLMSQVA